MKTTEAIEHIQEIISNNGLDIDDLAALVIWAYDKGWAEGREDYIEEQQERRSRCGQK
jgi:hypothetical protein